MPKVLSSDQVAFYRREGYLFPLPAIAPAEAAALHADLDRFAADEGYSAGSMHFKGHLAFQRSWDMARAPAILDAVEDLIGPNILVFASKFWIKGGGDGSFVSWHQDSAYFGLDPHELVTVWIALTEATPENGCMQVIPRSHVGPALSHVETYDRKNLLARGQTLTGLDTATAVDMPLAMGQFSMHHERAVHGSLPNRTRETRIGLSLFYIPTHVRSTIGRRTATLVRGTDAYGHWDPDPVPSGDRDPAILAYMKRAHERYHDKSVAQEAMHP
ncbi:MAG: phytanoyl-CoA dioxygenase family protein [Rhodospirillales bacterium]